MLNKNKIWRSFRAIFLISLFLQISCFRDPVFIDLSAFDSKLVIEGYITDQPGENLVRISKTVRTNARDIFPEIKYADVRIEDEFGNRYQLESIAPGRYNAPTLQGSPGRSYHLTVLVNGAAYHATSAMPRALEFSAVYTPRIPGSGLYGLICQFYDRENIEDLCRIRVFVNGNIRDEILYQDQFSDGELVVIDELNTVFSGSDDVYIELLTLDRSGFDFFYTMDQIEESEQDDVAGVFIPVTVYNPTTNLDNDALGYFSAHTRRIYPLQFE